MFTYYLLLCFSACKVIKKSQKDSILSHSATDGAELAVNMLAYSDSDIQQVEAFQ